MAQFYELSNEIVLLISSFVHPKDLDSFFLASKKIRELNAAAIAEHKRLTRTYRCLTYEPNAVSGSNLKNLANLLKDVLTLPRVAPYVEELNLYGWMLLWDDSPDVAASEDERKIETLSEPNRTLFHQAISKSNFIPNEYVEDWMESFEEGAEDQFVGLLFTLLPNLSILHIDGIPECDWNCHISHTSTSQFGLHDPKAKLLPMLTRVTLSSTEYVPLHIVQAFASLPSMRHIHAVNVFATQKDNYVSPAHSKVTHLTLINCQVASELLYEFLTAFKSLITFEYTDGADIEENPPPGSTLFWISRSLRHCAKYSLKKLSMKAQICTRILPMGSLRAFYALEELDISVDALLDTARPGCQKLSDVLPNSIKRVVLRQSEATTSFEYGGIVRDALRSKSTAFPRLEFLSCRYYHAERDGLRGFPLQFRAACEAAGITLTFD